MGHYLSNKKWRLRNTRKRSEGTSRYYDQTEDSANSRQRWTVSELLRVLETTRPCDRVLSEELGRSMKALVVMRSDYKNRTIGKKLLSLRKKEEVSLEISLRIPDKNAGEHPAICRL